MFDPKALFYRRLGNPIGDWLATGGVETLVKWAAYMVIFALFAVIIAILVDLSFGSGLFEQGTGCEGHDPYNPCPVEPNPDSDGESFRSK